MVNSDDKDARLSFDTNILAINKPSKVYLKALHRYRDQACNCVKWVWIIQDKHAPHATFEHYACAFNVTHDGALPVSAHGCAAHSHWALQGRFTPSAVRGHFRRQSNGLPHVTASPQLCDICTSVAADRELWHANALRWILHMLQINLIRSMWLCNGNLVYTHDNWGISSLCLSTSHW